MESPLSQLAGTGREGVEAHIDVVLDDQTLTSILQESAAEVESLINDVGVPLGVLLGNLLTANDIFVLPTGGHTHVNWAFSAPGTYTVSFEASGTLVDGNAFVTSGPVGYTFQVVPEPSTWALLGVSFAGFILWQRRRRHTAAQP